MQRKLSVSNWQFAMNYQLAIRNENSQIANCESLIASERSF